MTQSGPFRCTNMHIRIVSSDGTVYTIGVVEGYDIRLEYKGGPEPYYGSRIKKHSAGSKEGTFNLTRWFYTDTGQEDLLLDLFTSELEFSLIGDLIDNAGNRIMGTTVELTGCRLYKYRPRTGHADDIIGEEASGSATNWYINVVHR